MTEEELFKTDGLINIKLCFFVDRDDAYEIVYGMN